MVEYRKIDLVPVVGGCVSFYRNLIKDNKWEIGDTASYNMFLVTHAASAVGIGIGIKYAVEKFLM